MSVELVPFHNDLIEEAAILLSMQHRQDRLLRPELPERFAQPDAAQQTITVAWQRPLTQGVAALSEGKLVGYLFGSLTINTFVERTGWVRPVGFALKSGQPFELIGDLYASLGQHWVEYGCFAHYIVTPILNTALVQTWFSLGFGIEQVHGLCSLRSASASEQGRPDGIEIRRATPEDQEAIRAFSNVIGRQHIQAPCWAIQLPEMIEKVREGWAKMAEDPQMDLWLALQGEQLVGVQGYWKGEPDADDLLWPDRSLHLHVAGTHPDARRRGVTRELTRAGLADAQQQGYLYCETDWRSANLLGRRCWPNLGFAPYAYRLARRIDPRITWARGGTD